MARLAKTMVEIIQNNLFLQYHKLVAFCVVFVVGCRLVVVLSGLSVEEEEFVSVV